MGLSSSQARLLSLTGRMHDIEYKAQKLEAQKLQMANESDHVYSTYEDALNKTKIQLKQIGNDGSATYIDATYNNLVANGYAISFIDNGSTKYIASDIEVTNFNACSGIRTDFIARMAEKDHTTDGTYYVSTAEELLALCNDGSQGQGKTIILADDIDFSNVEYSREKLEGTDWDFDYGYCYRSTFCGNLDGNGHSITGLKAALFGNIFGGSVSNLKLENVNIDNPTIGDAMWNGYSTSVGALANCHTPNTNLTISNVEVTGTIINNTSKIDTYTPYTGALIGEIDDHHSENAGGTNTIITNVTANVTLQGYKEESWKSSEYGIVGAMFADDNNSKITNSSFTGTILDQNGTDITQNYTQSSDNITKEASATLPTGSGANITTDNSKVLSDKEINEYGYIYDQMCQGYKPASEIDEDYRNSTEWLSNMITEGLIVIHKKNTDGTYTDVNVATDTNLQEVSDDVELKKAEATYEADMRKIDAKDKKYDTEIASLEQERNAIKTEMDTLKNVAKENVDRTFKLFS